MVKQNLPEHLGGHMNKTHVDLGVLKFFKDNYGCKSLVDIGCGPGGQAVEAIKMGYDNAIGIDGDFTLKHAKIDNITWITHDYTTGPLLLKSACDLAWSCEFVEHVKEDYIDNYMKTFQAADIAAMTFHPPSKKENPWHFNEQKEDYWLDVFKNYGWYFNRAVTEETKKCSTMQRKFYRTCGLVFFK